LYFGQEPPPRCEITCSTAELAEFGVWSARLGAAAANETAPATSYPLTEAGNAERLADHCGDRFRYCGAMGGWFRWSPGSGKWEPGQDGLTKAALDTVRQMHEAAKSLPDDARLGLIKHALRSETEKGLRAMCSIARDLEPVATPSHAFDTDPWSLNVRNGTIDLRTGHLLPHDARAMHTQVAGVAYDAAAACHQWRAFLEKVVPDEEVRRFLQRLAGYCLTGDASERALTILNGTGRNGKSLFARILCALLGDYACYPDHDLLLASKDDRHTTEIVDLKGKRIAVMSEIPRGRKLATAKTKRLTGDEPVTGHRMCCDNITFPMTAKLVMVCNDLPEVTHDDPALWDRIKEVPFPVRLRESEVDPDLYAKLVTELPGILNWALDGLKAWRSGRLGNPPAVRAATEGYRSESDPIRRFLAAYEIDHAARLPRRDLRDEYQHWEPLNVLPSGERFTGLSERKWTPAVRERIQAMAGDGIECETDRHWHLRKRATVVDEAA
jgi:putative DNA primase/helicase